MLSVFLRLFAINPSVCHAAVTVRGKDTEFIVFSRMTANRPAWDVNTPVTGRTFPNFRYAREKDRLMLTTHVGHEDVLVPVICSRTVLHQIATHVFRSERHLLRIASHVVAFQIMNEGLLGMVVEDIRCGKHDVSGARFMGWSKNAREPDISFASLDPPGQYRH